MLWRLSVGVVIAVVCQLNMGLVLADKFTPNPLEVNKPDPLIPSSVNKHPLSLLELGQLETALDALHQEAVTKLQGKDKEGGFDILNREARLRRYLGTLAEVQGLSRFAVIAWDWRDKQQLQYINERLQVIQKSATKQKKFDLPLKAAIGEAYQKVRSLNLAIPVYEEILITAQEQKDAEAVWQTLNTLGEIHLRLFDYRQGAVIYEQLLSLSGSQGDRTNELKYLEELAYIYQQSQQTAAAVKVLEMMVAIYQQNHQSAKIPELQLSIGDNYQSLAPANPSLLQTAFNSYQQAYTKAKENQQYHTAAAALEKVIGLYVAQSQTDAALATSQILLETYERGVNFYGMMQTYAQIGKLYLTEKNYSSALRALEAGLKLARELKHQESYFTEQINQLSQFNF